MNQNNMCSANRPTQTVDNEFEPGIQAVEQRITLRVLVAGMRVVLGKVHAGVLVTLLTRIFAMSRCHAGIRIAQRPNIVGTMTIGTFGSRLVAKFRQFAVQTQSIPVSQSRMTIPTAIRQVTAKRLRTRYQRIVPLVAIRATGLSLSDTARSYLLTARYPSPSTRRGHSWPVDP